MLKILAKEYVCYLREPRLGRQDCVFRTVSLSITLAFNSVTLGIGNAFYEVKRIRC